MPSPPLRLTSMRRPTCPSKAFFPSACKRLSLFLLRPSLVDGAAGGKWQKVALRAVVVERLGGLAGKLMNREVAAFHSITSSARASSIGGTEIPSAFAVFKLITSSYLVGCSTGRSAGFAPLKILSTKNADRRYRSRRSAP